MRNIFYTNLFLLFFILPGKLLAQKDDITRKQIAALEIEKASRTPAQKKLASVLLQAIKESRGEKMAQGVDLDPAEVHADAEGNLAVDIKATITASVLSKIQSAGGKIIRSYPEYHSIRAIVNLASAEAIAEIPEITFIAPAQQAQHAGNISNLNKINDGKLVTTPGAAAGDLKRNAMAEKQKKLSLQLKLYLESRKPYVGYITSQGDRAHRADEVRALYGYEGQGIKIGVLSDSYNKAGGAPTDVLRGDLPGTGNPYGNTMPVTVVQEYSFPSSDEGRAMLQIVHDLAPKAQLFFATAFEDESSFANNIITLRNTYGCDIIIDDVFYFDEAVFQDGLIAQAVNNVTASGAMFFSSAGNAGSVLKGTAGVYEADFNNNGATDVLAPSGIKLGTMHNFDTPGTPRTYDSITSATADRNLSWSDSYGLSNNDYDLFLLRANGTVRGSSTNIQAGVTDPYEEVYFNTLTANEKLVVFKTMGAAVRTFHLNTNRGRLIYFTTGQTHGHASAVNAYCVAAAPTVFEGPYPNPFSTTSPVETFSSDGPRRIYFNPDSSLVSPGVQTIAAGGGIIRNKPDITAADGVNTTLNPSSGLNPFYGTSAAAPHAGAIAAMLKSGRPSLTNAQIRTILINTAVDVETPGYDITSGVGILQAFQAAQAVNAMPALTLADTTIIEGNFANNNGYNDPGETGNKVIVQFGNSSGGTASGITGVLSTNSAGVTIPQNTASFGTIASGGMANNSGTPYVFDISNSVACGSLIHFTLTVNYAGGGSSPQVFDFDVRVGNQPTTAINGHLGTAPAASSFYTYTTGTILNNRLSRNNVNTVCGITKAFPGTVSSTGAHVYDAFTFTNTNTSAQCVTVLLNTHGNTLYFAAYNNSGFVPTSLVTNFLGDPGNFSGAEKIGFTVAGGSSFTVVVFEFTAGTATGESYTLDVSLGYCDGNLVLPVSGLVFSAKEQKRQSLLTWKAENETEVEKYEVEYGTNSVQFDKINSVFATPIVAAEKTYSWLHPDPVNGNNYYRIKQIDKSGNVKLSTTELVKIQGTTSLVISPNPVVSYLNIRSGTVIQQIQLYSAAGRLLNKIDIGKNVYSLDMSSCAAGQYIIRVQTPDEVISEKVIKK